MEYFQLTLALVLLRDAEVLVNCLSECIFNALDFARKIYPTPDNYCRTMPFWLVHIIFALVLD